MASCTRIENNVQAYIDGELAPAERVIFEQHVAECSGCAEQLKKHQRTSALLFEAFSDKKLTHSLRQRIMEHLPEIEPAPGESVEDVNWRAKHPRNAYAVMMRRLPLAVAVVLICVGVVIRVYWPDEDQPGAGVLGVITQTVGDPTFLGTDGLLSEEAEVRNYVKPGGRYETGPGGAMMVSLLGPTTIKLSENTRVAIQGDRRITVEEGEIFLEVARDKRRFLVHAPSGDITVLGTSFLVKVRPKDTTVTVANGEVYVESSAENHDFVVLNKGEQSTVRGNKSPTRPAAVDVKPMTAWAEKIVADKEAETLFVSQVMPLAKSQELPAKKVYWVSTLQGGQRWAVSGIRLYWAEPEYPSARCSYEVYVYDEEMRPLFKDRFDGQLITPGGQNFYEISVPDGPVRGMNEIAVRLVPDFSSGKTETDFQVVALGL